MNDRSQFIFILLSILFVVSIVFYACNTSTPKRDTCVAPAILDYQATVIRCKSDGLNFEQCDEKYNLESALEEEQVKCRKADDD